MDFMQFDSKNRNVFKGYLPWRASALADIYRNMIVEQFLDTEFDYLWFLDSDIQIDNTTLYKLLDLAESGSYPVVSGIYPTIDQYGQTHPSLWHLGIKDGLETMIQYEKLQDVELKGDHYEVDGVGAGCLLLSRNLLLEMRSCNKFPPAKPWFDMEIYKSKVPMGEDYTFCLRVASLNYPIVASPVALVDHYKEIKLTLKDASYA